ncbi:site-specific DNA-methyltransferase [Thermococcus sp. SY098]|uniref:DNA-methyltransferase n=1 Tax=Thermococcus sp. SY098 TaxID=3111325 RepID=UPI002D799B39|nr:site-specific DNA-methyltransferase [Thermococcus sp. SY098]WRS51995.1 site-specific DNA-methyltransferase [Thermococcus sp. SY098]
MMKTVHKIVFGDSRRMYEVEDESVHLVVTSPPYPMIEIWDDLFRRLNPDIDKAFEKLKATSNKQKKERIVREIYELMHETLLPVWEEVYRVLVPGGIACINIGDATRKLNGNFRLFPNHAKIIEYFEKIGFITLPYILWKKPTNKPNAFLGSGFLPPNAYVTLDVEYILIFRKGEPRKFKPKDPLRYASRYTKEERDKWFSQIWEDVKGERQTHPKIARRTAAYPEEIPRRLIRMFSIIGDTVLDPFLGTGTTTKVAIELQRNSIGYEIDESLRPIIEEKIGVKQRRLGVNFEVKFIYRE